MKRIVSVLTAAAAAALGLCLAPKTYAVPEAPDVELTVENHDRASMKWEDNGADGYTVYKRIEGSWTAVGDEKDCEYVDKGPLSENNEYTVFSYRIEQGEKIYGNYDYRGISIEVSD